VILFLDANKKACTVYTHITEKNCIVVIFRKSKKSPRANPKVLPKDNNTPSMTNTVISETGIQT
jgi:hypothetical protein